MEKLIIFDLDGVLVDSKDIHFKALNQSLNMLNKEFVITEDEHLKIYNGLPTKEKLKILNIKKSLPVDKFKEIEAEKQRITKNLISQIKKDKELIKLLKFIKDKGIRIAVASNSIRDTIITILENLGVLDLVEHIVSNEDVRNPKPHPEMFWSAISYFNTIPSRTVIFEDSIVGKIAAKESGAGLITVENRKDLNIDKIEKAINLLNENQNSILDLKINIVIPMAGEGRRFQEVGYSFPKPLIDVEGKTMIEMVVKNIGIKGNYIFIVKKEHQDQYNLEEFLKTFEPDSKVITVEGKQKGAAHTILQAKELINNEHPLLIFNSDQLIEYDSREFIYDALTRKLDGSILTFNASHPKWSYVKKDEMGYVTEVAEKKVISNEATVGGYLWMKGLDFVKYSEVMIEKDLKVNGEFYVCPVFNEAVIERKKIGVYKVKKMHGLGTPEDLKIYLERKND